MNILYDEGYCCGCTFKKITNILTRTFCCCNLHSCCIDCLICSYDGISSCCFNGDYEYVLICCAGFYSGYTSSSANTETTSSSSPAPT